MKKLVLVLLALSLLACTEPRRCHLQQVEVKYSPAHPCTKYKTASDGSFFSYEGFCPEQCVTITTCTLWCDEVDALQNVEQHPPHPTVTQNLGSNSTRCNDQGQPLF